MIAMMLKMYLMKQRKKQGRNEGILCWSLLDGEKGEAESGSGKEMVMIGFLLMKMKGMMVDEALEMFLLIVEENISSYLMTLVIHCRVVEAGYQY